MIARIPLPPGFDAGPFTVGAATRAGAGRSRLNGRDLSRPFWGIRVPVRDGDGQDRVLASCRALLVRMPPGAFFSHSTAAQLIGLPLPLPVAVVRPLHVGVAAPQRAMDARGIAGHSMVVRSGDVVEWNGLPVTAPARTWLDLAPKLSLFDLVAIGDYLVRRERPLTTVGALANAAAEYRGRRGRVSVRAALPLLRTGAESPRESVLRLVIVFSGLPEPECNLNLYDAAGRFLARGDLVYPEYKLVLEYQGDQHRTDRAQWRRDIHRTGRLEDNGWQVLQFTDDDLKDPRALVARIALRLGARGWAR